MKKILSIAHMTLIVVSLLLLGVAPLQVNASEAPEIQWSKTYGGTKEDGASSVVQTTDGGYAIAGTTSSPGHMLLLKTVTEQPPEPDFEITVSPPSQAIGKEDSVEYKITVTSINDFESEVPYMSWLHMRI